MKRFLSLLASGVVMLAAVATTSHAQMSIDKIKMGTGTANTMTIQTPGVAAPRIINIPDPGATANIILSQLSGGQTVTGTGTGMALTVVGPWQTSLKVGSSTTGALGATFISSDDPGISGNMYYNGANWIYDETAASVAGTNLDMAGGQFTFANAPAGVGGANATLTTRMQLTATGALSLPTGGLTAASGLSTVSGAAANAANQIQFRANANNGTLTSLALNGTRTWSLPDNTGTLALTSDLSAYLPLAGGTMTGNIDMNGHDINNVANIRMPATTATAGTLYIAGLKFLHSFGSNNTFAGGPSGNFTLTGTNDASFGTNTLPNLTSGSQNTAMGAYSMVQATSGNNNTADGYNALNLVTTGSDNTGIGNNAGVSGTGITTGTQNTLVGSTAQVNSATATNRTAIGYGAAATADNSVQLGNGSVTLVNTAGSVNVASGRGYEIGAATVLENSGNPGTQNIFVGEGTPTVTIQNNNAAVGFNALHALAGAGVDGNQNTAVGAFALAANLSDYNTAVGYNAAVSTVGGPGIGLEITAVGGSAAKFNVNGNDITAIGSSALLNVTGNDNTGLGANTGRGATPLTSGTQNTLLGSNAMVNSATAANRTAIGYNASANSDNTVQLGNTSVTLVNTSGGITAPGNATLAGNANTTNSFGAGGGSTSNLFGTGTNVANSVTNAFGDAGTNNDQSPSGTMTNYFGINAYASGTAITNNFGIQNGTSNAAATVANNFGNNVAAVGAGAVTNTIGQAVAGLSATTTIGGGAGTSVVKLGKLTTNGVVETTSGDGTLTSVAQLGLAQGGTAVDNTNVAQNLVFASPNGATGSASFRALVAADVPTLNQNTTGSAGSLNPGANINGVLFTGAGNITITAAPSGSASGDLAGTYPGPTIANSNAAGSDIITAINAATTTTAISNTALTISGNNETLTPLTNSTGLTVFNGGTGTGANIQSSSATTGVGLSVSATNAAYLDNVATITNASTAAGGAGLLITMSNGTATATGPALQVKDGHILATQTAVPTVSGTLDVASGNTSAGSTDVAGKLNFTMANPLANAGFGTATVNFSKKYGTAPFVVVTPADNATALIFAGTAGYYVTPSTTGFTLSPTTAWAGAAGATYSFYYHVIE